MDLDLDRSVSILERTPAVLRALLSGLPEEWTHREYGPATWTAHQVVGHLIWGERTDWIPRARHILEVGDAVPFEPFDRAGHEAMCRATGLPDLLDMFADERAANLQTLRGMTLSSSDLNRPGRHPALGPVTMSQLLAMWTVHDLNHIAQISKAMAFQYREAVGPWKAYSSILSPPNPR